MVPLPVAGMVPLAVAGMVLVLREGSVAMFGTTREDDRCRGGWTGVRVHARRGDAVASADCACARRKEQKRKVRI
jgi:hypothetical protein